MRIVLFLVYISAFIKPTIKIAECILLKLVNAKYTYFSTQIELYTQLKHCYHQISRLMLV